MKLPIVVIVALVVLAIVGGGAFFVMNAGKSSVSQVSQKSQSVVESVASLLSSGATINCKYEFGSDGTQTDTYAQGEKVYSAHTRTDGSKDYVLINGKSMWIWYDGKKEGTKVTIDESFQKLGKELMQKGGAIETLQGAENPVAALEKYKDACKTVTVEAKMFEPPTTVTFTDYSEQMKAATDLIKNSGMGISDEDLENLKNSLQVSPNQ